MAKQVELGQHDTDAAMTVHSDDAAPAILVKHQGTGNAVEILRGSVVEAAAAPDWQVITQYKVGQFVVRGGRILQAKTDHTSEATYGGFSSSNWVDIAAAPAVDSVRRIVLRGSATGADSFDTTPHLEIESYQRPSTGPFGESIRFKAMAPKSKQMLSWWFATDPSQNPNEVTNPMKQMVWAGAHYGAQDDSDGVHGHYSIEVPAANGNLASRFGIDFLDNRNGGGSPGTVGADITSSYFSSTDVTVKQGEGEVLRLTAGAGSNERVLEFAAQGNVVGQPPGYVDTTKRRWWLLTNQDAESGSDAGSNLVIRSFTDVGVAKSTIMYANRASGNVTFGNATDGGARVSAIWAGGSNHGFYAVPSASPSAGFSAFAAKLFAVGDRALDLRVAGDANPRLTVDGNGKHSWGNAAGATDITLQRLAAKVLGVGAAETFRTGVAVTGSRPTASSVGAGSQFYDSTLSKPIWSDGTSWRDAAGTAV